MGAQLRDEFTRLKEEMDLPNWQAIEVAPRLSPVQVAGITDALQESGLPPRVILAIRDRSLVAEYPFRDVRERVEMYEDIVASLITTDADIAEDVALESIRHDDPKAEVPKIIRDYRKRQPKAKTDPDPAPAPAAEAPVEALAGDQVPGAESSAGPSDPSRSDDGYSQIRSG